MNDIVATNVAQTPPPRPRVTARDAAATAQSFEAVFIGQMTRILMDTAPTDGPFSGGHGEEMFRGILAEKLGDTMAKRGGLGLAPAVLKHIILMQERQR